MRIYYLIISRNDLYLLRKKLENNIVAYVESTALREEYILVMIEIREIDLIVELSTLRVKCKIINPFISINTYKKVYRVSDLKLVDTNAMIFKEDYSWFENVMASREHIDPIHNGYYIMLPVGASRERLKEDIESVEHCNYIMQSLDLFLEDDDIRHSLSHFLIDSINAVKNKEKFNLKNLTIEQIQDRNDNYFINVVTEFINRAKYSYSFGEIYNYCVKLNLIDLH